MTATPTKMLEIMMATVFIGFLLIVSQKLQCKIATGVTLKLRDLSNTSSLVLVSNNTY